MRRALCLSLLCVGFSLPVFAKTITVGLTGGADFTEIQPAIDAAEDGDVVLVAADEYVITEPINLNRLHDAGDPNSPQLKNIKVRSEAGPDETIIRMAEEPADVRRASVAIFENSESDVSVLEGFTLTGGIGTEYGEDRRTVGGGVLCLNGSSPTLRNCTITGNSTADGAGVSCLGSSPTLINCTISGNSASGGGGGVSCHGDSSPTLTNCTISGNSAVRGGGVDCFGGSPSLTNCTISGNSAETGGGVFNSRGSSPTLTNCIVWDNVGGSIRRTSTLRVTASEKHESVGIPA